jgi:hypothetical protein
MGMSRPEVTRRGLLATRAARADTVGTITLDRYTRVGDHASAGAALAGVTGSGSGIDTGCGLTGSNAGSSTRDLWNDSTTARRPLDGRPDTPHMRNNPASGEAPPHHSQT